MPTLNPTTETPAVTNAPEAPAAKPETIKPGSGKTVKKAPKKAAPKKAATPKAAPTKKAAVKKAATPAKSAAPKKAAKATGEAKERGPSKTQVEVMKLLAKKGEMTRGKISEALDGAFIGGNVMGHVDESKRTETSLVGRGLCKVATYPDKETQAEGPAHYDLTAAGKKFVESLNAKK